MSINVCVYRGRTASCEKTEPVPQKSIPFLPWGHTKSYCNSRERFCGERVRWKTAPSLIQIVPSNSRPVPQPRLWRAPGRPMPSINLDNSFCNMNSPNCEEVDMNNTPLDNTMLGGQTVTDEEYLAYSNPTEVRTVDGVTRVSFYNGPGWKASRIFGASKSHALPRPIKHWRKQLFPRQQININTGMPYHQDVDLGYGDFAGITEGRSGGRSGRLSMLERPGGGITLDLSASTLLYENGYLNTTNCVRLYFPGIEALSYCGRLREEIACKAALQKARPGHAVKFNRYAFTAGKMYLQSRVKLHSQQATIQFNSRSNLPVLGWQGTRQVPRLPPSTVSLYSRDVGWVPLNAEDYSGEVRSSSQPNGSGCFISRFNPNPSSEEWISDCSCAVPVTFKPRNNLFARDSAVASSTNISRKRRQSITRNQYNVTNKWGIKGYDTIQNFPLLQYRTRGKRTTVNGAGGALNGRCCPYKVKLTSCDFLPVGTRDSFGNILTGCILDECPTWANTVCPVDVDLALTFIGARTEAYPTGAQGTVTPELMDGAQIQEVGWYPLPPCVSGVPGAACKYRIILNRPAPFPPPPVYVGPATISVCDCDGNIYMLKATASALPLEHHITSLALPLTWSSTVQGFVDLVGSGRSYKVWWAPA